MTDTTRWDMVGCYGNPQVNTPNLDALAEEGIRYDRAYTCQPVCGPARSAVFTGLYPHSNGSWSNSVPLYQNVKTIGQRMQQAGIDAAYVGKWHLDGGDYFGNGACPPGWDAGYWYDMRNYLEELTEEERVLSRQSGILNSGEVKREFTFGHRCSNRAIDYLQQHENSDFLLVVSYDEPHDPYLCPEPYSSMFREYDFPQSENVFDNLEEKPDYQRVWAGKNLQRTAEERLPCRPSQLLGCNAFADDEIGRVLRQAKISAPEALIIFTSDHGDGLGAHSIHNKGPCFYDEVSRVPLLISGGTKGVYPHPVSHINLTPTILDYFALEIPKALEGKSLLKTTAGSNEKVQSYVFTEFGRYEIDHDGFGGFQPMRAVTDGRWKLSVNLLSSDELYDLETDPHEMNNRIWDESCFKERNRLHDALLARMNETRDPFRGYYWECRPWRSDAAAPSWDYTGCTRQRETETDEPRQLDYGTGLPITETVRKK